MTKSLCSAELSPSWNPLALCRSLLNTQIVNILPILFLPLLLRLLALLNRILQALDLRLLRIELLQIALVGIRGGRDAFEVGADAGLIVGDVLELAG